MTRFVTAPELLAPELSSAVLSSAEPLSLMGPRSRLHQLGRLDLLGRPGLKRLRASVDPRVALCLGSTAALRSGGLPR